MASRFAPKRSLTIAATWLWFWLRRPWLAIVAALIGAILVLAVWQLPQLPGQFVDEHAAAANWLLTTSTAYGIWGNALLALGLFDVLRSPLLYLLLALLLPTLATQLADQLGALRQYRDVQKLDLQSTPATEGEALALSKERSLYRHRSLIQQSVEDVATLLEAQIQADFSWVDTVRVGETSGASAAPSEVRVRGWRQPRVQFLRPLLMVGLLLAVLGAWIALAFGWQVTAPPLAPGSTFRSANRDLVLHYAVPVTDTQQPILMASFQNARIELPAEDAARRALSIATLQMRPAYPAVQIATSNGEERLTLPGDATLRNQIGLVFADPGSEESVLIPDQGTGLRVVQRAGSDNFVLELYRSDAVQPVYRGELTPGGQLTIPFSPLDPGLVITAMPGLQVDVRHLPGLLLVPVGILIALIGMLAFQRDSAFVVAQVARWTPDHTVVILQGDRVDTIAALRRLVESTQPATPAPAKPAPNVVGAAPDSPEAES